MQLTLVTPPAEKPLTLDEAKAFLGELDDLHNDLIQSMIDSAVTHTENILNRQLGVATFEGYADHYVTKLPKNPIKSIDKIEIMVDGNYVEVDSSKYYLYEEYEVGCIEYIDMPTFEYHRKAVKITFTCGYDVTPEPIKTYIKTKISTLFENREEYVIGASISKFDDNLARNLLVPYRIMP